MEAEFRAVTMLSRLVSLLFSPLMDVSDPLSCCFLISDEGEKFRAGEVGIVHISLTVCF